MLDLELGDSWYGYGLEEINSNVSSDYKGNYALGYEKDSIFYPKYVGRSDSDLKNELINYLEKKSNHTKFMFRYASTEKEAYEKECKKFS